MESSVRKKLSVAYADFCSTQKTVAANLAKTQGAAFKDDIVSIDKYEKMYQDFEDGNPFVKLMTKQATVNNFIKILKGVDTTQDGLVYLDKSLILDRLDLVKPIRVKSSFSIFFFFSILPFKAFTLNRYLE